MQKIDRIIILMAIFTIVLILSSCQKEYNCTCKSPDSKGLYTIKVSSSTIKAKNATDAQSNCSKNNHGNVGCGI